MSSQSAARRAGAFVRSVLPAEPAHWLVLLGSTFFLIAPYLRWWPEYTIQFRVPFMWSLTSFFLMLMLVTASAIGYFAALIPCRDPSRYLSLGVLSTSFVSIFSGAIAIFQWFPHGWEPAYSVIEIQSGGWPLAARRIGLFISNLGPGFQFATAGFVLIALFVAILRRGRVSLPVRFKPSPRLASQITSSENESSHAILFAWAMICLVPIASLSGRVIALFVVEIISSSVNSIGAWAIWAGGLVSALTLLALVLVALGKEGRKSIRPMLHFPSMKYVGLAFLFPAGIACVWPIAFFLRDRILWAGSGWGEHAMPVVASYLRLPEVSSVWLLAPAFVEEVAWRGYLQPRFVHRFGLARGVFLIGIVWGAFHFSSDFNQHMMIGDVLLGIVRRLVATVAYSYVLAWLTVWSRSIFPAALAHATLNAFIYESLHLTTPFWLFAGLWAILGYVLFHYFPPQLPDEDPVYSTSPPAQGAVEPGYNDLGG